VIHIGERSAMDTKPRKLLKLKIMKI